MKRHTDREFADPWGGKPGTNWTQVSPADRAKLKGLMEHYRKQPRPFTACVRDNTKRFGPDGANRVCAVLKDLIHGGTDWRKGGKKMAEEIVLTPDELRAVIEQAEAIMGEREYFGFNPAQPRAAAGATGGGRWAAPGGRSTQPAPAPGGRTTLPAPAPGGTTPRRRKRRDVPQTNMPIRDGRSTQPAPAPGGEQITLPAPAEEMPKDQLISQLRKVIPVVVTGASPTDGVTAVPGEPVGRLPYQPSDGRSTMPAPAGRTTLPAPSDGSVAHNLIGRVEIPRAMTQEQLIIELRRLGILDSRGKRITLPAPIDREFFAEEFFHSALRSGFNPNQLRAPKHTPIGGRWIKDPGGLVKTDAGGHADLKGAVPPIPSNPLRRVGGSITPLNLKAPRKKRSGKGSPRVSGAARKSTGVSDADRSLRRTRARQEREEGTPAFQAGGDKLGPSTEDDVSAAGRKLLGPLTTDEQQRSLRVVRDRWAELDRQLHDYIGAPDSPQAQEIIREQKAITKVLHRHHLDTGNPEGIGQPGGPRDVVIVGAGPAGLQAAISGASEGLDTMLIDANDRPGGQIGMSSRVENVLGFPAGITGAKLAEHGLTQAERLGAHAELGVRVNRIEHDPATGLKKLHLSDGRMVEARAVVVAGGVQPRPLSGVPGSDSPDVVYGDSALIRERAGGRSVVIVGAANSAGQAALDVASTGSPVTILVRRGGLRSKMSHYLAEQLETHPKVRIRAQSEIASMKVGSDGRLISVTLKDGTVIPCASVGVFIGSAPDTSWLGDIERDERGYITVGKGGAGMMETNMPGVFAAGDVRAGTIHRVASAASDGGAAISETHSYLAGLLATTRPPKKRKSKPREKVTA